MFQFQYGSIKSSIHKEMKRCLLKFQFQYGSIKRFELIFLPATFIRFNSNMVRLKVKLLEKMIKTFTEFQFQYGSIKSQILSMLVVFPLLVSIPIWFD